MDAARLDSNADRFLILIRSGGVDEAITHINCISHAAFTFRRVLDLENAKSAKFYRRVGTLGRVFVEIEAEAFALAA